MTWSEFVGRDVCSGRQPHVCGWTLGSLPQSRDRDGYNSPMRQQCNHVCVAYLREPPLRTPTKAALLPLDLPNYQGEGSNEHDETNAKMLVLNPAVIHVTLSSNDLHGHWRFWHNAMSHCMQFDTSACSLVSECPASLPCVWRHESVAPHILQERQGRTIWHNLP